MIFGSMDRANQLILHKAVFYRLTALWVFFEAFAGGILHGFKIPFTGMVVSSLAVMCIILIAWHVPSKTAVIKATIIVAIFKLMLSPHASPTAYVAVFFQGALGQLLLHRGKLFRLAAIAFAILALVESSLQRLLVLIVLYGNEFWVAVNKYIQKLTGSKELESYTWWLAAGYILIHLMVGIFVGWYAGSIAKKTTEWTQLPAHYLIAAEALEGAETPAKKKRKKWKWFFAVAWLILGLMFFHAYIDPEAALLPKAEVLRIFLRSLLIVLSWYLIVLPVLRSSIKKHLEKEQAKRSVDVQSVLSLLPQVKFLFVKSWAIASS
ncbi:MAG: hypothetical protein EOO03_03280, partial [Chitinophagaceae bacterium]